MKAWHPMSVIVLILTICIGIGMIYGMVVPLVTSEALSDAMQKTVDTIYASSIAIVTMYIGGMLQKYKDKDKE